MKIPGSTRPPRIHGELLKLGFEVAQSSVAKYMVKRRAPPSTLELKFSVHTGQSCTLIYTLSPEIKVI